jgi:hypothetical protein
MEETFVRTFFAPFPWEIPLSGLRVAPGALPVTVSHALIAAKRQPTNCPALAINQIHHFFRLFGIVFQDSHEKKKLYGPPIREGAIYLTSYLRLSEG